VLRTKSVWSPIHRKTDGLRILATRFRGSDDDFLYARDVIGGNTGFHRASRAGSDEILAQLPPTLRGVRERGTKPRVEVAFQG